jgi:hypothetical protein
MRAGGGIGTLSGGIDVIDDFDWEAFTTPAASPEVPMRRRPAFLTGSRAYGVPREDSDIDIVMHCEDDELIDLLFAHNEKPNKGIWFGRVNLIVVNAGMYDLWREGTDALLAEKAKGEVVTRAQAVEVFKALKVSAYGGMGEGAK